MGDMLIAATTIALSWDLTPTDMNCNLMPLFHVGGIVRQVFSPLFSGGGVICCPSFDPFIFWALLEKEIFTWYYAAPTMHQLILQTGRTNGFIHKKRKQLKLRMIANAAGGLLPSLAEEMMDAFDANVRCLFIIFLENLSEQSSFGFSALRKCSSPFSYSCCCLIAGSPFVRYDRMHAHFFAASHVSLGKARNFGRGGGSRGSRA